MSLFVDFEDMEERHALLELELSLPERLLDCRKPCLAMKAGPGDARPIDNRIEPGQILDEEADLVQDDEMTGEEAERKRRVETVDFADTPDDGNTSAVDASRRGYPLGPV